MIRGSVEGSAGRSIDFDLQLPEGSGPFPLVLVCHGFKGFRNWGYFPEIAKRLAAGGLAAIRIDLSHNGIDRDAGLDFVDLEAFELNRPSYEREDLNRVLDAVADGALLADQPLRRGGFGLFGHSRGGAAALLAAASRDDVAAVVTWASVATVAWPEAVREAVTDQGYWEVVNARTGQVMRVGRAAVEETEPLPPELDLAVALPRVADRLLLVHGEADPAVPIAAAETLVALGGGRPQLLRVPDADHVMNCRHPFTGPTPAFETAIAATIAHFRARL